MNLKLLLTFLNGWKQQRKKKKKKKQGYYFVICENYMKFKSHCPLIEFYWNASLGLPLWLSRQRILLQWGRPGFSQWVGKIPWRRERLLTPVFWPGEFQGLCSPWGHEELDVTEWLSLSLTLLKCNQSYLHIIYGSFMLQLPKLLLSGHLEKKFAKPSLRILEVNSLRDSLLEKNWTKVIIISNKTKWKCASQNRMQELRDIQLCQIFFPHLKR